MTLRKRLLTILILLLVTGGAFTIGLAGFTVARTQEDEALEEPPTLFGHRETLYLWYTDEALTDYLSSVAVSFNDYQDKVRVIPVHTFGLEYLETINQASLLGEEVPDLYIVGNDSLEKAYLAGLASQIAIPEGVASMEVLPMTEYFPETALLASTYLKKQIAYPLYFETSSFLYNKTYLEDWARSRLEAEADAAAGEAAQEAVDNGDIPEETDGDTGAADQTEEEFVIDDEMLAAKIGEALPEKIEDILAFAEEYDAPEQVESVFKWDVSDIFYNYFFVGNYIDVGGATGDDKGSIDIYNEDAIRCMRVYQDLNQFFSIDTKEISYDSVLQDFIDGKIVYTVATSDALARIEEAKENGEFEYEYETSVLPDVSNELASKSLSVTQCVVINGYSVHKDMANEFAVYLTCLSTGDLYNRTGKLPARKDAVTEANVNAKAFLQEYEKSVPIPKMIETSNYWIEMEIAFARIWDGEDENLTLKALSEQIMAQIEGGSYTEEYIDVPEEVVFEELEEGDMSGEE